MATGAELTDELCMLIGIDPDEWDSVDIVPPMQPGSVACLKVERYLEDAATGEIYCVTKRYELIPEGEQKRQGGEACSE